MRTISKLGSSDAMPSPQTPRINADLVEEVAFGESIVLDSGSYVDNNPVMRAVRVTEMDERCPQPMRQAVKSFVGGKRVIAA